jgi:NAD+ synthase
VFPDYGPDWSCKVVLSNALHGNRYSLTKLVVQSPTGERKEARMPLAIYQAVVAATNMKQRTRKQLEYYHADRLNYAVAGTPNRLEYDQGFFVKNGDGAADFKPIAHLYKSQVYQLAEELGIPAEICRRPPTTDTWSMAQTQEEFYFALPYTQMDQCLYGLENSIPVAEVARATALTPEHVMLVWQDIEAKRKATRYLHAPPMLIEDEGSSSAA